MSHQREHNAEDLIGQWVLERIRLRRISGRRVHIPDDVLEFAESVGVTPPPDADGSKPYTNNAVKDWLIATLDNPDWA